MSVKHKLIADVPPNLAEILIPVLFGVPLDEFIEKLHRGDYGDIWRHENEDETV